MRGRRFTEPKPLLTMEQCRAVLARASGLDVIRDPRLCDEVRDVSRAAAARWQDSWEWREIWAEAGQLEMYVLAN